MYNIRYKHTFCIDGNHNRRYNRLLIIMAYPSSLDGDDNTVKFLKNNRRIREILDLSSYRNIDLMNLSPIVDNPFRNTHGLTLESTTYYQEQNYNCIRNNIENHNYDKILYATGQDFTQNNRVYSQLYKKSYSNLKNLLSNYRNIVYCCCILSRGGYPICICKRNINRIHQLQPFYN